MMSAPRTQRFPMRAGPASSKEVDTPMVLSAPHRRRRPSYANPLIDQSSFRGFEYDAAAELLAFDSGSNSKRITVLSRCSGGQAPILIPYAQLSEEATASADRAST
jgi:hypothetical protein